MTRECVVMTAREQHVHATVITIALPRGISQHGDRFIVGACGVRFSFCIRLVPSRSFSLLPPIFDRSTRILFSSGGKKKRLFDELPTPLKVEMKVGIGVW